MKFWFTKTLDAALRQQVNLVGADLRVKMVMTNNTCVADRATARYLSDIGNVDEYNGTGYTEITCTGESLAIDAAVPQVELKVDPGSWGSNVGIGTRKAAGYLVYQRVDGVNDPVLGYSTEGGFPLDGAGGPFTLTPDVAAGLLTLA